MIKVFIGNLIPGLPYTEILFPNLGNTERLTPFGEAVFAGFTAPLVEIVAKPEDADYFCIPHNYNQIKDKKEYLENFAIEAEKYSKKILVFVVGDSDEEVPLPNAIVFRNSQYNYKKLANEIIMPAYACDLGDKYDLVYKEKTSKPTVGFCGWASYSTVREWVSYGLYNLMESLVGKPVYKKGLYFRRRALNVLKKSGEVAANFIIRSSYSGNEKTLKTDPTTTRREYVENMKQSDFILAPKGDGNFSVRFFEALSLGRIPLLVDTDCPLPLADEIEYNDFILKVDHTEIDSIAEKTAQFYAALSPEDYLKKQEKCRRVFEDYLQPEAFFAHVLRREFLTKYEN